jgi:hypothetical protein
MATETIRDAGAEVADAAAAARARLEEAESQAGSLIREYPLGSLVAAVVAGYVVARLVPRL